MLALETLRQRPIRAAVSIRIGAPDGDRSGRASLVELDPEAIERFRDRFEFAPPENALGSALAALEYRLVAIDDVSPQGSTMRILRTAVTASERADPGLIVVTVELQENTRLKCLAFTGHDVNPPSDAHWVRIDLR